MSRYFYSPIFSGSVCFAFFHLKSRFCLGSVRTSSVHTANHTPPPLPSLISKYWTYLRRRDVKFRPLLPALSVQCRYFTVSIIIEDFHLFQSGSAFSMRIRIYEASHYAVLRCIRTVHQPGPWWAHDPLFQKKPIPLTPGTIRAKYVSVIALPLLPDRRPAHCWTSAWQLPPTWDPEM